MKRGDLVTVAVSGDYGKPRPAVVITSDTLISEGHDAIVLCQLTSTINDLADFRVAIDPSRDNGLKLRSDIMADKPVAVSRRRIGSIIGRLNEAEIQRLNAALAFALGLSN